MSKTETAIKSAKSMGSEVLIGYFPAGYPTIKDSIEACVAMCESGVDVLELGVPYSDPVMDGLVIQEATEIALANGFRLRDLFPIIREVTSRVSTPVLVMSYWNPILQYGLERFATDLKEAGAAGLITPDLIPDEAASWIEISENLDLDRVFLATPSSSEARLANASKQSRGFVYAVSTMGITGAREELDAKARAVVSGVRKSESSTPVCVGIGISTQEQVAEVNSYSDGAIVGSALIKAYKNGGLSELSNLVKTLKAGNAK
jgi:tryptophan synthase alpha chain